MRAWESLVMVGSFLTTSRYSSSVPFQRVDSRAARSFLMTSSKFVSAIRGLLNRKSYVRWEKDVDVAKRKILGVGKRCVIFDTHSERQYNEQSLWQQAYAFALRKTFFLMDRPDHRTYRPLADSCCFALISPISH